MAHIGYLSDQQCPDDNNLHHFIGSALTLPADLTTYSVTRQLTELFPTQAIIESFDGGSMSILEYAAAGHCKAKLRPGPFAEIIHDWQGQQKGFRLLLTNAFLDVEWREKQICILVLTMSGGYGPSPRLWVIADRADIAQSFIEDVLLWSSAVRGEILVYDCCGWRKDKDLLKSIEGASFDNLVLRPGSAESIHRDMEQFFESRDLYDGFGIPWKRGVLFTGPPGNGKTHALKALINRLRKPTIYVKTFEQGDRGPSHDSLRAIFCRTRSLAPCILVLEDLDSLIDDENRSYFLNEMDGFTENRGVLVLATTNHPERVDPAIIQRPSRFDRRYQFDLPAIKERVAYLQLWNRDRRNVKLTRGDLQAVARLTEGFSYAYLKELMLSAMITWIGNPSASILTIASQQAKLLRDHIHGSSEEETLRFPTSSPQLRPRQGGRRHTGKTARHPHKIRRGQK